MELTVIQVLERGVSAHRAGDLQEAERIYRSILQAHPHHPDANHNLGVLAVSLSKVDAAIPLFKKAVEANPKVEQFWLSYIGALTKLNKVDEASALLSQAKSHGVAGEKLKQLEGQLSNSPKAIGSLKEALDNLLRLHNEGKFQDAVNLGEQLIKQFPNDPNIPNILGQAHFHLNQLEEAIGYYNSTIQLIPNHAETHYRLGVALDKAGRCNDAIKSFNAAIELQPNYPEAFNGLGISHYQKGNYEEAIVNYNKAVELKPYYAGAFINLAAAYIKSNYHEKAIRKYKAALKINPALSLAYNNLGSYLLEIGELKDAKKSYDKAVILKPNDAEAYSSLANVYKESKSYTEAIAAYKEAIKLDSGSHDLFFNNGTCLLKIGRLEDAKENYYNTLMLKPNHAEAYFKLGQILTKLGQYKNCFKNYKKLSRLAPNDPRTFGDLGHLLTTTQKFKAAEKSFKKALILDPRGVNTYHNLSIVFKELNAFGDGVKHSNRAILFEDNFAEAHAVSATLLGLIGDTQSSISAFTKSLIIDVDNHIVWNNVYFPLKVASFYEPERAKEFFSKFKDATTNAEFLKYQVYLGQTNINTLASKVITVSKKQQLQVSSPYTITPEQKQNRVLPKKIFSLLHFGRSGTGFLHSLIDNHEEVSTTPSVYFSEYFNSLTWKKIAADGWDRMVDNFIQTYPVLFDARSSYPIRGRSGFHTIELGIKEGMAGVGEKRDEFLFVDQELFRSELTNQLTNFDNIDAYTFFQLVHISYEKALGNQKPKSMIFYHIHNPDVSTAFNFLTLAPKNKWVMMVREPIQSCESWIREHVKNGNYLTITSSIITMLHDIDNVIFQYQEGIGVRLEDLTLHPKRTIPALCKWMGISERDSLYESTAQGKKWWGDPSSPDYGKNGQRVFDSKPIERKVGSILSKNDQFVLRTLFYPFSVKFGYTEENPEQFKSDLEEIRPKIDKLFDFEKELARKQYQKPEQLIGTGPYLYLRAGLIGRWNVLNQFQTYPNMLEPLKIK